MKNNTCGNSHLIVQNDQNNVIGLLNAETEIEPSLVLCLQSKYDCEITIKKAEKPDSEDFCYFIVACMEEGADKPYDREISVSPVWLYEEDKKEDSTRAHTILTELMKCKESKTPPVTFSITTRVIAESQQEAAEKAPAKIIADPENYISFDNWESTKEDIENPFDKEDMEFILFPNLEPLDPEQEILVSQAWEMHLREVKENFHQNMKIGHNSIEYLKRMGTKLKVADRIKEFIHCTPDAFEHYRY